MVGLDQEPVVLGGDDAVGVPHLMDQVEAVVRKARGVQPEEVAGAGEPEGGRRLLDEAEVPQRVPHREVATGLDLHEHIPGQGHARVALVSVGRLEDRGRNHHGAAGVLDEPSGDRAHVAGIRRGGSHPPHPESKKPLWRQGRSIIGSITGSSSNRARISPIATSASGLAKRTTSWPGWISNRRTSSSPASSIEGG